MSDDDSLSPSVRVFMSEKEALWYEFEHVFSQQGSSSEGNRWVDVPSAMALSQVEAIPSGQDTDEVDSNDVEVVYSEEALDVAMTEALEAVSDVGSHLGKGMLLKNSRLSMKTDDIK